MRYILAFAAALWANSALASSPNFGELMADLPCAAEVQTHIGPKLAKQTWVPRAFSEPGKPLMYGIMFRDTISMKVYEIAPVDKKAWVLEYPAFAKPPKIEQHVWIWDSDKNCSLETYTRTRQFPPFRVESGYRDEDLKQLVQTYPWGVIYVTNLYPPAVEALKELKAAVDAKGGHLTVILCDDLGPATAADFQPLLTNGGIAAGDLKPLASFELFVRMPPSTNYPDAIIYRDGFLSNRSRTGPLKREDYERWINYELADLKKDLE